jgi:hypothetical protein
MKFTKTFVALLLTTEINALPSSKRLQVSPTRNVKHLGAFISTRPPLAPIAEDEETSIPLDKKARFNGLLAPESDNWNTIAEIKKAKRGKSRK